MKTHLKNPFLLTSLAVGLGLMLAGQAMAQSFTNLYSFTALPHSGFPIVNSDGAYPWAGLILSSNTLYGTTYMGGSSSVGTVFAVNTDGTGFTNLHSFGVGYFLEPTNDDGANPQDSLILSGNALYGTAYGGGISGYGTVFAINTDGTDFTNLHNFGGGDGAIPNGGLVLAGQSLYGTTASGGANNSGTVFAINTDGTGFTNLYNFSLAASPDYTNSDGYKPYAGLILSNNILYGTAAQGGSFGKGTVFAINTDGTGFTNLHNFAGHPSDGGDPFSALILSGNTLYGTAAHGGNGSSGTVFAVNTDGTGFTNLYAFTAISSGPLPTNSDGGHPYGGLIMSGHTLYGTASGGGSSFDGTIFAINTDGTGFTNLHTFTAIKYPQTGTNTDGGSPQGRLLLSGASLFGTAAYGGSGGHGTVFRFTIMPEFQAVTLTNGSLNLTWSTEAGGVYQLQCNSELGSTNWVNMSNAVTANGATLNTTASLTNGPQCFYRLVLQP